MQLREADGTTTALIEKVPVLGAAGRLAADVGLPVEIDIPCDVIERILDDAGHRSALIRLHFAIEDGQGRGTLPVPASQITTQP